MPMIVNTGKKEDTVGDPHPHPPTPPRKPGSCISAEEKPSRPIPYTGARREWHLWLEEELQYGVRQQG